MIDQLTWPSLSAVFLRTDTKPLPSNLFEYLQRFDQTLVETLLLNLSGKTCVRVGGHGKAETMR